VLVRFPFSDLSGTKLRPAVVLADVERGDFLLCQVTSKQYGDPRAVQLDGDGLASGLLHVTSYARPGKLFAAHQDLINSKIATLKPEAFERIVEAIVRLLRP
jgi:mRNA interferase MazF